MKKNIYLIIVICFGGFLASCATAPPLPPPPPVAPGPRVAVHHTVAPGETLWRIGKMYDVPVEKIIEANKIDNPSQLKMGQVLVIPGAASVRPVVTLYPSKKWKYIIIHHSATEEGNSLAFHMSHKGKGWDSIGYHFVIDNGSSSKKDGQIETTPRWLKQLDGAHCKAGNMNTKAIGICLVGNFDKERVTTKQMESLVYLVTTLKRYYRIPSRNILRHGEVRGATTHCPGKKFPWSAFKRQVR